jgi:hypothetical protein
MVAVTNVPETLVAAYQNKRWHKLHRQKLRLSSLHAWMGGALTNFKGRLRRFVSFSTLTLNSFVRIQKMKHNQLWCTNAFINTQVPAKWRSCISLMQICRLTKRWKLYLLNAGGGCVPQLQAAFNNTFQHGGRRSEMINKKTRKVTSSSHISNPAVTLWAMSCQSLKKNGTFQ